MQTVPLPWRGLVATLAVVTLVVVALGMAGQYSVHHLGHDHLRGVIPRLDLNAERSLPTGVSALLIGLTAAVTAVIALLERARRSSWRWHWAGLALLLALMALEEVADFHTIELIPREPALRLTGFLHMTWVIFGAAFVLLFAAAYFRFWGGCGRPRGGASSWPVRCTWAAP